MKRLLYLTLSILSLLFSVIFYPCISFSQTRTIHVFVALCDNVNQGIVPVPAGIGNGQKPATNLYWGAGYGIKTYFKSKTTDWQLVASPASQRADILDRLLFKHATLDVYMLAEAYDGAKIKTCTEDFIRNANGQKAITVAYNGKQLPFGGQADLVCYVGHDGLMDFEVTVPCTPVTGTPRDVMILACYSKMYFSPHMRKAGANPILWTSHLMAPEAYTLKAAIDGWLAGETGAQIKERAAQTYNTYQKCGIKGARNLFVTGF